MNQDANHGPSGMTAAPCELLPCPFCGIAGHHFVDDSEWHTICCNNGECLAMVSVESHDKQIAIAAWNRRAAMTAANQAAERIAELEAALAKQTSLNADYVHIIKWHQKCRGNGEEGQQQSDAGNLPSGMAGAPREHDLKTWPEFFAVVLSGEKTFELRKDDRAFRAGDVLRLREWCPVNKEYTGREIKKRVSYIISGNWGLERDVVCMALSAPQPYSHGQAAESSPPVPGV